MQLCSSLNILWHCPSLELKWKVTFSSPVATAEFSKFVDLLNAAFSQHHLLGFSSTGIPSPPLALFIVMLPKAYLTSHSRMSGSRWMITPSWLCGSLRPFFVQFFCVFLPPLLNLCCLLGPYHSVLYCAHLCMKCSLGISLIFLMRSHLSHSVMFLYFFALIIEKGFLFSCCSSLELCIQMGISFLFSFAFCFSSFTAICKASSDSHFAFLHFFFLGMVLILVSCTMSQTCIHSSSGTLSDLIPWIYFSLLLYNCRGFDLGHTWMV